MSRYVVYRYLGIFDVQCALTSVSAFSFLSLLLFTFSLFLFFVFILFLFCIYLVPFFIFILFLFFIFILFLFFVLCAPAPLCLVLAPSASAPSPHCPLRVTSVGAFFLFLSSYFFLLFRLLPSSFPSASFFFSAGCHPASPSSIMPVAILFFFSSLRRLPSSFPPDAIRHLRRPLCRMSSGLGRFTCAAPHP